MPSGMRVFRSTDAGAPVLTGETDKINVVLESVLSQVGWTVPFRDAVNGKAVYLQKATGKAAGTPSSRQFYFRFAHNIHEFSADIAEVSGFETMSSVDVGTGPFPVASGQRQNIAYNTPPPATGAIPWNIYADGRTATVVWRPDQQNNPTLWTAITFGDYYAYHASDSWNAQFIFGVSPHIMWIANAQETGAGMETAGGHYAIARRLSGAAGGISTGSGPITEVGWAGDAAKYVSPNVGRLPSPAAVDSRYYGAHLVLGETGATAILRGVSRGLRHWCHTYASTTDQQVINGGGTYAGRTWRVYKGGVNASRLLVSGVLMVEETDTWETN